MAVPFDDDGNDRVLRLDSKVESSLLEGQHVRCFQVGASSLGEDENSSLTKWSERSVSQTARLKDT